MYNVMVECHVSVRIQVSATSRHQHSMTEKLKIFVMLNPNKNNQTVTNILVTYRQYFILQLPSKIVAHDILKYILLLFCRANKAGHFVWIVYWQTIHIKWNCLLGRQFIWNVQPYFLWKLFKKKKEKYFKMLSAAVVIGILETSMHYQNMYRK